MAEPLSRLPSRAVAQDAALTAAVRAAAGGDREAFAVIVAACESRVIRMATRVTGNPEEGRDLAQEVFLSLWKILPRMDLERPLMPYLYRATVNKASRLIRKRPPFIALDAISDPAAPSSERRILDHQMRRAFAKLSRGERLAVALTTFEGLTAEEAGPLTGRSPATLRVLTLRARRTLAKALGGGDKNGGKTGGADD